jgi:hypothetical protein
MKVLLTIAPGQAELSVWNGVGLIGDAVTLINGTAEILPALTMLEESRIIFCSENHSATDSKMFGGQSLNREHHVRVLTTVETIPIFSQLLLV